MHSSAGVGFGKSAPIGAFETHKWFKAQVAIGAGDIMWKVIMVEDDDASAAKIREYLERFGRENGEKFDIRRYADAVTFLTEYDADCDIVLMDIEMPDLSGMDASRKLRETDSEVTLIFITNLVQYAVSGYEVSALDFIVKPVSYYNFVLKIKRALRDRRLKSEKSEELSLSCESGVRRVAIAAVKYIEVAGHHLIFHTFDGIVDVCGTLKDMETELAGKHFSRCNNCYLVNLKHVSEIGASSCVVGGEEVQISRRRRKSFIDELTMFVGGSD